MVLSSTSDTTSSPNRFGLVGEVCVDIFEGFQAIQSAILSPCQNGRPANKETVETATNRELNVVSTEDVVVVEEEGKDAREDKQEDGRERSSVPAADAILGEDDEDKHVISSTGRVIKIPPTVDEGSGGEEDGVGDDSVDIDNDTDVVSSLLEEKNNHKDDNNNMVVDKYEPSNLDEDHEEEEVDNDGDATLDRLYGKEKTKENEDHRNDNDTKNQNDKQRTISLIDGKADDVFFLFCFSLLVLLYILFFCVLF